MARLAPLLLCATLAAAGCGGSESESSEGTLIDWDVSTSHTTDDVDWPKPDLSAVEISPVESVRIRLPAGRRFAGGRELVHDVTLDRRGDLVRGLQVDSHPRTRDQAYELAGRRADEWNLSRKPFDEWREGARKTPVLSTARQGERIGDTGPIPTVEIRHSFEDERPALVSLQLYWPD
jgi:hypothetical protein